MNGNKLFVDTNILLYFLKGDEELVELISDKDIFISFITELEILSFPKLSVEAEIQIKELLGKLTVIEINQAIKNLTIELRRKHKLQLPDAIIAASAYFHNLPFLTADKDFKKLEEMNIVLFRNE